MLKDHKEILLSKDVSMYVRFVNFSNGILNINLEKQYPKELINNLNKFFTNNNIKIITKLSDKPGDETLETKKKQLYNQQLIEISNNPIFKEISRYFPNYIIETIENI